jgi:hypothetical protein
MRIVLIMLVFSILIGCQGVSHTKMKLLEKDLFSLESGIFNMTLSPDNKALFVHGVEEVAVIDAEKGDLLGFNLTPELGNAIWSPNGREFLSINDQGNYEYIHLGKENKHLEEGLVPTAWSPEGKKFYAYLDNVLYEIEPPSLAKTEIKVDDRFSNRAKRILTQLHSGIKLVEYDRHNLLLLDGNNKLLDYIPNVWEDSAKVSPNEKLIAFSRLTGRGKSEVWAYDLETMSLRIVSSVGGDLFWKHTSDQLLIKNYGESLHVLNLQSKEAKALPVFKNERFMEVSWIKGGDKIAVVSRKFFYLSAKDIFRVVDTVTGRTLLESDIKTVGYGRVEWSEDGKKFYYTPDDVQTDRVVRVELVENSN